MTATSDRIRDVHFPKWLALFEQKSKDYGEATHEGLGIRGQFSDMYRKFVKLKKYMWDEPEMTPLFESVEEIIYDLIGHCFLTLDMINRVKGKVVTEQPDLYREHEALKVLQRMWAAFDDDDEDDEVWVTRAETLLREAHVKNLVGH